MESLRYIGGIVGGEQPSRYSQSPFLWNLLFQRLKIPAYFAPFDLSSSKELGPFLKTVLQTPHCIDLTVTNPYKYSAYQALESLNFPFTITERVHRLQSLNHILLQPDTWFVDSTDGEGMVRAIKKRTPLEGARVLLVGAGGAAASIGYELVLAGAELRIVNIIEEDAHTLKQRLGKPWICTGGWDRIPVWAAECDIIISAITESSPLDREGIQKLPPSILLVDTRYGEHAEFAHLGRSLGRTTIDGREMLFGQFYSAALRVAITLGIPEPVILDALERIEIEYLS
ncbi:MAG: hypothetical protein N2442_07770 [Spirochaetes bacterium]|nr:hypothetical protein [Spirochaetota bacterium]